MYELCTEDDGEPKVDSKHPEKLLSLVILCEQPASLNTLARTPANICGQA